MGTAVAIQALHPMRSIPFTKTGVALHSVSRSTPLCSSCNLRERCLPCGLKGEELGRIEAFAFHRKRIARGERLYQAGDTFKALYAVRFGFFKSYLIAEDGRNQVTGFQMSADVMGMDGIETGHHGINVVALEDSEVCTIPYAQLDELSGQVRGLQRQLHRVMSREIVREHGVMMLLGSMRAEERVATFLLNLSHRFAARGYSALEFNLRMTREEIGSYLGLKLETVSRILSKFQECGLISAQNRYIRLLDVMGLKELLGQVPRHAPVA